MIEVVSERGYPDTRVVNVIGAAGVSRKTFSELFDSKEDCSSPLMTRSWGTC